MQTKIKLEGETIVIRLDGKIDFENQIALKENLRGIIQDAKAHSRPRQVVFDFGGLEFVGSCGISNFVQTLRDFNRLAPVRPKYFHVRSEFQRVMRAFDQSDSFEFTTPEATSGDAAGLTGFSPKAASQRDH